MLLDNELSIKYQSTNSIGLADNLFRLINAHQNFSENSVVVAVSVEPEIVSVFSVDNGCFHNTINYLTTQINNETSFETQQRKVYYFLQK